MGAFELTVQHLDGSAMLVRVQGSLDLAYAYRFDEALRRAEREGADPLVVDLRAVEFLDSTGISRLLAARRRARRARHRLVLVRGPERVQRLFAIVALQERFEFVATPEEAVGGRPAGGAPAVGPVR